MARIQVHHHTLLLRGSLINKPSVSGTLVRDLGGSQSTPSDLDVWLHSDVAELVDECEEVKNNGHQHRPLARSARSPPLLHTTNVLLTVQSYFNITQSISRVNPFVVEGR